MKNLFLMIGVVLCSVSFAQENTVTNSAPPAQHEVSLNLPISIFAKFPMFSYEYLSSSEFGFGSSLGFSLDNGDDGYNDSTKFQIVPFVRWYFLNTGNETIFGKRFFIEANASLFSHDKTINGLEENKVKFGLGMGIGYKYVNTSNWIGSIYLGAGRTFSDDDSVNIYPHLGVNIGKRF